MPTLQPLAVGFLSTKNAIFSAQTNTVVDWKSRSSEGETKKHLFFSANAKSFEQSGCHARQELLLINSNMFTTDFLSPFSWAAHHFSQLVHRAHHSVIDLGRYCHIICQRRPKLHD